MAALYSDPEDKDLFPIVQQIQKADSNVHVTKEYKYFYENDWVIRENAHGIKRVYLPRQLRHYVVNHIHKNMVFHLGWERTAAQVKRIYYWRNMDDTVKDVVGTCPECLAYKPLLHPQLVSKPHNPPLYPLQRLVLDYATGLRKTWLNGKQYDAVLVIIDAFTKYTWIFPTTGEEPSEELIQTFIDRIYSVDGLPNEWVSDNDSRFISKFTQQIAKRLNIKQAFSLPGNARSHGQVERAVGIVEQCIIMIDKRKNWAALCPMIQVALNMAKHSVTGFSPHYALRGRTFRHQFTPQDVNIGDRNANLFIERWQADLQIISSALYKAQQRMSKADLTNPPKDIAPGTKIYISHEAFTGIARHKLLHRFFGPYTVKVTSSTTVTCEEEEKRAGVVQNLKVPRRHVKIVRTSKNGPIILRDFSPESIREAEDNGYHKGFAAAAREMLDTPAPESSMELEDAKTRYWYSFDQAVSPFRDTDKLPSSLTDVDKFYGIVDKPTNSKILFGITSEINAKNSKYVSTHRPIGQTCISGAGTKIETMERTYEKCTQNPNKTNAADSKSASGIPPPITSTNTYTPSVSTDVDDRPGRSVLTHPRVIPDNLPSTCRRCVSRTDQPFT